MYYRRTMVKRGATIFAEAYGDALGLPGGDVNRWTASFREKMREFTAAAAPVNKRGHHVFDGVPLKQSINRSKVKFHKRGAGFRLYATVGSTKNYAAFVDQGTKGGIARRIPPWKPRYPYAYTAHWFGGKEPGMPVRGQKAQHFFDKGIRRAFAYKRLAYSAGPRAQVAAAMNVAIGTMPDFRGATPAAGQEGAYKAQWDEWIKERDEAFRNNKIPRWTSRAAVARRKQEDADRATRHADRKEAYKRREAERSARNRAKDKASGKQRDYKDEYRKRKRREINQMKMEYINGWLSRNRDYKPQRVTPNGVWFVSKTDPQDRVFIKWSYDIQLRLKKG